MKRPPLTAASPQQALAIRSLATYAVVDACRRIGRSISWHIGIRPNGGARTSMCPRLVLRVWGWRGRELILHGRFISTCRNSGRKHKDGHGDDVANDLHDNSFMFRQDCVLPGAPFGLVARCKQHISPSQFSLACSRKCHGISERKKILFANNFFVCAAKNALESKWPFS
jgi:hypothetical protein